MFSWRSIILSFIFIIAQFTLTAQPTGRITMKGMDHIDFVFNTFTDLTNGKEYTDYTTLHIYYCDTSTLGVEGNGWQLDFKADNIQFEGYTNSTLALNVLEIEASGPVAPVGGALIYPAALPLILKSTDQTLVEAGKQDLKLVPFSNDFTVTYYCGQNKSTFGASLWNTIGDYFIVNIQFTLISKP